MARLERQLIDGERISVVPNFLSVSQCEELIQRAESSGFKTSPPSGNFVQKISVTYFESN